jgi:uncharacterized protein (TIGR03437 family)
MERKRKLYVAKAAVIMGSVPVLIWAYAFGPDPGYSGVPGENGDCTSCHIGRANSGGGSVNVALPGPNTYTPGVKQHLKVTISDTASTARRWGFQLTARLSSDNKTMAGTFQSTDQFTTMLCATTNFAGQTEVKFSPSGNQACPASRPLHYIEHSDAGTAIPARLQTGGMTYEFDWIPPATNVGNVDLYMAGNAANASQTEIGDNIYTKKMTLTPAVGGTAPTISADGVVNGASFQPGIVPGSWLTIKGTNLASQTDTWEKAIVNGKLPTTLDGVSVNVGSKPAYVYFISPGQINVQAPDVGTGPVPVTVTNANGTSAPVTATVVQAAPACFQWPGSQAIATFQNGSYAVKSGTFPSLTTVAAKPGDIVILWATGFGPTTPPVDAGIPVPSDKIYNASPVTIKIGGADAQVFGAALSPGSAGLYQIAIQVPAGLADGDHPIKATVNGVSSPDGVVLSVKK